MNRLFPLLGLTLAFSLSAADWPQFLGPKRNGVAADAGPIKPWPKTGPTLVWEHAVGEGFAGPVVASGRVVVFHRVGDEDLVECLEAASGKPLWKYAYATDYRDALRKGNGPRATPLVADGRVYTLGAAGVLTCLSFDDGKKIWDKNLLTEYEVPRSFFGVGSSPLLEGGRLLVNVGGRGAGVVAFDAATGKELWKATDQGASYASPVAATIDGVRHALFFTRDGLLSLDPETGAVRFSRRWRSRMDASVNAATPQVVGDQVFLTASYDTGAILLKVRKDGVEEVWKGGDVISAQFDTPVVHDGLIYGCDGRDDVGDVALRCVELKTGKVGGSLEKFGCASGILVGSDILWLTTAGDLVLMPCDPSGFKESARANILTAPVRAHPALADGKFFARDNKRLGCWDLAK